MLQHCMKAREWMLLSKALCFKEIRHQACHSTQAEYALSLFDYTGEPILEISL